MFTIYHNPRCKKSREGLAILEKSEIDYKIIKYLENPLTKKELEEIIGFLQISPIELIRTNEQIWKDHYKGKKLSFDELVTAMLTHPKLIERPIVVKNNKAVIGRPASTILELL